MFRPSLAHHQGVHSCIEQSQGHIIISNIRSCDEIINVCYTEANMYTTTGAAYRLECVHGPVMKS
jgi:hypothetical protein